MPCLRELYVTPRAFGLTRDLLVRVWDGQGGKAFGMGYAEPRRPILLPS